MKLFVSFYGNMIFWSQTSRLEKEHNELCMKWVILKLSVLSNNTTQLPQSSITILPDAYTYLPAAF